MDIIQIPTSIEKVDKIFHIADIHIRPYKRHHEYKQVFQSLYDSIKSQATANSVIAVLGDIVHAKTEMSPELIDTVSDFFNNLASVCYTIIVPGNHDANLNNKNRMDAISPILKNINNKNLVYLKDSGVYCLADLYFVNMSVFNDTKKLDLEGIKELKPKIALFHGVVDKAINKFGFHFRNEKIDKDVFNDYDLVLLGDIHKHQYLAQNIAYPGSLIQQNHGEDLEHGYILWDMSDLSSEFIKIPNDYGYYTLEIRNGIIPEVTDIPKKCRLRIQAYDIIAGDLTNLILEIKKKYKPTEITINRINSIGVLDINGAKLDLPNITDVDYQNKLIEDFVVQTYSVDKEIVDAIKQINIETNLEIEVEDTVKNVRWTPIRFEWSNMFSYGEGNYVEFADMKGVIGLFGPNATGKSAFVDSLSFCLFDKASKDFKPINIMNNKSDEFICKVVFELSNRQYFIERKVWKNKSGNPMYKVNFGFYDDKGVEQSLNGENRWGTNKNIDSYIGSFEDFALTTFSMQGKSANFIEKGHSDRKDLIIQFVGLGLFDKLFEIAAEKNKETNISLKTLETENWDDKLIAAEHNFSKYEIMFNEKNNESDIISNNIIDLETEITDLTSQLINIDEDLSLPDLLSEQVKLKNDLGIVKWDLNAITYVINENQKLLAEYKERIDVFNLLKVEDLYNELASLESDKKDIESEINTLQVKIDNELDKMQKLTKLEYDPDCNYCMNNIFVKDAITTKKLLVDHEKMMQDLNERVFHFEEIIKTKSNIKTDYDEYKDILKKANDLEIFSYQTTALKTGMENNISALKLNLKEIDAKIKKYYYFEKSIKFNEGLHISIDAKQLETNQLKNEKLDIDKEILDIFGKLKVEEANIKTYKDNIKRLNKLRVKSESYKYYISAIKRDGIPYDLITKIVPAIELEINNILSQIVDFSIVIDLDESKNINMYIVYDEENFWTLELASGMEQFIASIAIRVALTNVSHLPRPNFLIVDEGWGTLDGDNLNSVSMLLDYLKTQFEFVLIISHVDQIKEVADIIIELKKEDDFSVIKHPF